jgi:hypothetical protein
MTPADICMSQRSALPKVRWLLLDSGIPDIGSTRVAIFALVQKTQRRHRGSGFRYTLRISGTLNNQLASYRS